MWSIPFTSDYYHVDFIPGLNSGFYSATYSSSTQCDIYQYVGRINKINGNITNCENYDKVNCTPILKSGIVSVNPQEIISNSKDEKASFVSPNPCSHQLKIYNQTGISTIKIINSLSQILTSIKPVDKSDTLLIDISNLPTNVYFIVIEDFDGYVTIKKVVKM
ncbi:MAG: hypothetical protein CVU06_09275 [Bacteroidetes bacterium HGW-Bacteroidetes-22]|nr:MAG: hypothetical protein CVU06_09275 [Bacteroidetes bacterium HGW-Bacteroidetes-22]